MAAYGEIQAVRIIIYSAPPGKVLDLFFKKKKTYVNKVHFNTFSGIFFQVAAISFSADLWPFEKSPLQVKLMGERYVYGPVRLSSP
jgi:hypothetical protein